MNPTLMFITLLSLLKNSSTPADEGVFMKYKIHYRVHKKPFVGRSPSLMNPL